MSENQKDYIPLVFPLNKPFIELSKAEAQEYFDWFISHIDERSDYLRQKVSAGLNIPIESLDFSLDSLKPIWKWFLHVAETTESSQIDIEELEQLLEGQSEVVRHLIEQPREILSVFTEYVLRDIGMYVAKVFTSNYDVIRWTIKRTPKRYVHVNEPLLIGFIDDNEAYPKPFYPDLEPVQFTRMPALKLIRQQQPSEDDLYNQCIKWIQWILKNKPSSYE